jgi:hypothetical protein
MKAINGGINGGAEVRSDDGEIIAGVKAALKRQDESSWEVADGLLALSRRGWTQVRIGKEFGVSQSTVSKHIACARKYSAPNTRPSFWEAFQEVDGHAVPVVPIIHTEQGEPKKLKLQFRNTTTAPPRKIAFKETHVPLGSAPAAAVPPPMSAPSQEEAEDDDDDEAGAVEVPALEQVMLLLPLLDAADLRVVRKWLDTTKARKPGKKGDAK